MSYIKGNDKLNVVASGLIKYARSLAFEEKQAERIVISLKKLGQNEELIEFVKESINKNKSLVRNVVLLENSARAKIDLAKICIDTGRNVQKFKNKAIPEKALEKARLYLEDAEHDLNIALENVSSAVDRESLEKDLSFLNKMKKIADKPKK